MEVEQAILTRRSIRKYTDEDVTDEQIDKILQAAYWHRESMKDGYSS